MRPQCLDLRSLRMKSCDKLLSVVGENGWYQRRLLLLYILPVCFYIPIGYLSLLMQIQVPDHWCHVPGRPADVPLEQWWNQTLPSVKLPDGTVTHSKCAVLPSVSQDTVLRPDNTGESHQSPANSSSNATEGCPFGWEFDRTVFAETAATTYLWVCDQKAEETRLLTVATIGNLVGSIVFGMLADRVGRRGTFFLLMTLLPTVSILSVLVLQPVLFVVLRFLAAVCYPVLYQLIFTLGLEFTGVSQRSWFGVLSSVAFTLGMCVLPLVAYLLNHWVYLGLATAAPAFLFLAGVWLVDESPRWLLSRGRRSEAQAVLARVAVTNGARADAAGELLAAMLKSEEGTKEGSGGLLDLLRGPRLRLKMIALTICWASNVIMYYGLMLGFSGMTGNVFLNFFLLALVELPSNALALYSCSRFGRRKTQLFFFCASGASLLAIIPLKFVTGLGSVETALRLVAKFNTSLTFVVLYIQCAELYPTCVRSLGTGLSSLVGIGAGTVTPYILQLGQVHPAYPFAAFGALGVVGTFWAAQLPETQGRPLPETLADAEIN